LTEFSRTAVTMVSVEEGEDPVPGNVVKIHDGNTRENRDAIT